MSISAPMAVCLCVSLHAGSWAPIPQTVWDMKEDPAQGIKGAVVLERRMMLTGMAIQHRVRVRVLSEAGRAAVAFLGLTPESCELEGRTVQRDGSVVLYDKVGDFTSKTLSEGGDSYVQKGLIPPGVTPDCVVEVRWAELVGGGEGRQLPTSLGYSAEWTLGAPYKVLEDVVEFGSGYKWSATVLPGRGGPLPEVRNSGRTRTFVFRDLPAREEVPFSLAPLADRPVVMAWYQPELLVGQAHGNLENYWQMAARNYWERHFKGWIKTGRAFRALAEELTAGLPADPAEAASLLLRRLDRRIRNVSFPTLAERSSLDIKAIQADDYDARHDLEQIVRRGAATAEEMGFLFITLLEKAGIHPRLALVQDRTRSLLRLAVPNVFQMDDVLVGVPMAGRGILWLEPGLRYAAPGLVHPDYQGWDALLLDTARWQAEKGMVPIQPAAVNVSRYAFTHAFPEEAWTFQVKADFTGYPEYRQRRRFMSRTPEEQARTLKEALEKLLPEATVTAAVQHAFDPDANVTWSAEGALDRPGSGSFHFNPFPGMPSPLAQPVSWPERRTEPVVLEHLGIQVATSEFDLPAGYRLAANEPFVQENSFGKVGFWVSSAPQGGATRVKAVFKVEVLRPSAPAEAYREFRTFMDWIDQACRRRILLERP